jgi:hypothetical protein
VIRVIDHINLKGVIDYLIFSRKSVSINDNNEPIRSIGALIVDRIEKSIIVSCVDNPSTTLCVDQSYILSTEYKSKLLSFAVTLTEIDGNDYHFEFPLQGTLIERRSFDRAKPNINNLDVTVSVDSTHETIEFRSAILVDFSFNSFALYLDRKQGLVIPGDIIRNIAIKNNGHTIFESNGVLLFVDKTKQYSGLDDTYFVVIQLFINDIDS